MEHMGVISLLPTAIVILLAVISKRALEPLIGGVIVGYFMLNGMSGLDETINSAMKVLENGVIRWIILAVGLFGALTSLLVHSGGAMAFSHGLSKIVKNRASALISTWILGIVIFIDDYLNALTVGNSMKGLTDKHKVSRQMLAYIVDTTAAPICVLIPLSTWAIYVAGLLEENGAAPAGEGLSVYISAIPYMLYPIIAAILVPLVAIRVIPPLGAMKKAEERAERGESTVTLTGDQTLVPEPNKDPKIINFLLPIGALLFFTWFFDIDILKGVVAALVVTYILYIAQGTMPVNKMFDVSMEGLKSMIPAIVIIVVSFLLKDVNDTMGLASFVIESVQPFMTAALLPLVVFVTLAIIAFATGSFWGMYAVAFPIILPLGAAVGVDTPLLIGAIVSAGAFGSHACFYGDSTVLSATATGCDPMDHAITQLPYVLIAAGLAMTGLLILASS